MAIVTAHTNTDHRYCVFLPDTKKSTVSAENFIPSPKTEGAPPLTYHCIEQLPTPLQTSQETSIDCTYTDKGNSLDSLWRQ